MSSFITVTYFCFCFSHVSHLVFIPYSFSFLQSSITTRHIEHDSTTSTLLKKFLVNNKLPTTFKEVFLIHVENMFEYETSVSLWLLLSLSSFMLYVTTEDKAADTKPIRIQGPVRLNLDSLQLWKWSQSWPVHVIHSTHLFVCFVNVFLITNFWLCAYIIYIYSIYRAYTLYSGLSLRRTPAKTDGHLAQDGQMSRTKLSLYTVMYIMDSRLRRTPRLRRTEGPEPRCPS